MDKTAKAGKFIFSDEGVVDGVQYVTVLDADFNPVEYNVTIDKATRSYGMPADWYDDLVTKGVI